MGFELVRGARLRAICTAAPSCRRGWRSCSMPGWRSAPTPTMRRWPRPRRRGAALGAFFGECDAMLVPAAPGEAPKGLGYTGNPIFNRMWTLLGTPCVTLPARVGRRRAAVGVQLVGRIGDDARLMACAMFARTRAGGRCREARARRRWSLLRPAARRLHALDPYATIRGAADRARRSAAAGRDLLQHACTSSPEEVLAAAQEECGRRHDADARGYRLRAADFADLPAAAARPRDLRLHRQEVGSGDARRDTPPDGGRASDVVSSKFSDDRE